MYYFLKRLLDIIFSLIGIIFLTFLFPFIALAIKLDSPGPVIFKAKRISRGREFNIYKFRSMKDGAANLKPSLMSLNERPDGPFFKISHDPRITRVGRFLRRFWLDELPQLFNVLKNDISLVGPRPYEPEEINAYPPEYAFLKKEKAGITGLTQIHGSSTLPFRKVLEYDSYYARHKCLSLDLKIILLTLITTCKTRGV